MKKNRHQATNHKDHSPTNISERRLVRPEHIQTSTNKLNFINRTLDYNSRPNIEIPSDPTLTNERKTIKTTLASPNRNIPTKSFSSCQPPTYSIYNIECQNPITSPKNLDKLEASWQSF